MEICTGSLVNMYKRRNGVLQSIFTFSVPICKLAFLLLGYVIKAVCTTMKEHRGTITGRGDQVIPCPGPPRPTIGATSHPRPISTSPEDHIYVGPQGIFMQ